MLAYGCSVLAMVGGATVLRARKDVAAMQLVATTILNGLFGDEVSSFWPQIVNLPDCNEATSFPRCRDAAVGEIQPVLPLRQSITFISRKRGG